MMCRLSDAQVANHKRAVRYHLARDAHKGLRSFDENEAHLEEVILLIRQRRLSTFFSLIFRHKSELIAHPQIQIGRDPIHFISTFNSRRVEPIEPDSRMREFVYHRYGGLGVCAQAGKSPSRRNVISPAQNTAEQRQPFRDRITGVERDAVEIVPERYVRLKGPVRVYYRDVHIAVVIIHSDGPGIVMKDAVHE